VTEPLRPYDQAAYERFCSDLAHLGFRPEPGTGRLWWSGPTRASLTPLTNSSRIQVVFFDGWPYRYAHVVVPGFAAEHVAAGIVCLWAEDDPAQIAGSTVEGLFRRLDEWAASATGGWGPADQALDPHIAFGGSSKRWAEIDLPTLLGTATNGHVGTVHGRVHGQALHLSAQSEDSPLSGPVYFRTGIARPPQDVAELRAALARRQRNDLDRGLAARRNVDQNERSGGHDHVVLAWPRHGTKDALILSFSGTGPSLKAHANATSPVDTESRLRRAGPDATLLATPRVLLAGAGSIGGHVAVILANSGLGRLTLSDSDGLRTVNLVRHVLTQQLVGDGKTLALSVRIQDSAPWCKVDTAPDLSYDPVRLADQIRAHDLVIDCTGSAPMTSALAYVAAHENIPLLSGAIYHRGAVIRIRRQAPGDTPLGQRASDPAYIQLPPDTADSAQAGFLELGCTAPVHNAPPVSVLRAAADLAAAAVDLLTGRRLLPDETLTVLTPLPHPPFDAIGTVRRDRHT
jgi:molybdopterin/thiamine biosynthesis adenylyltransferase